MMIAVIGSAMSRIGAMSWRRNFTVSGPSKLGTLVSAYTITATVKAMMAVSRVRSSRRHSGWA